MPTDNALSQKITRPSHEDTPNESFTRRSTVAEVWEGEREPPKSAPIGAAEKNEGFNFTRCFSPGGEEEMDHRMQDKWLTPPSARSLKSQEKLEEVLVKDSKNNITPAFRKQSYKADQECSRKRKPPIPTIQDILPTTRIKRSGLSPRQLTWLELLESRPPCKETSRLQDWLNRVVFTTHRPGEPVERCNCSCGNEA